MRPDRHLIRQVLSLPTAPFHEEAVIRFIKNFVKKLGLRCQQDRYGNLKIVYRRGRGQKPFALTAHMDHPGFEVVRGGRKPVVRLLGGVPDKFFRRAKVIVWDANAAVKGKTAALHNKKRREFRLLLPQPVRKGAFGTFDLPFVQFRSGNIYTKAADDIVNIALLLNFLQELVRCRARAHVIFLFTRAEEVGFVGALGVAKAKWLNPKIPVIVLEASSAKAGKVRIGGGPVLRVGDKASTFSHAMDAWLQAAAQGLQKKSKRFQWQRALLSGGRCESTVFVNNGHLAGCLALPLGNYHNIGPKNYAMEYVSLNDFQNMLAWLWMLTKTPSLSSIQRSKKEDLQKLFQKWGWRLKHNPDI